MDSNQCLAAVPADPAVSGQPPIDLVAEANHRIANSLALLGGLVRMQARAVGKARTPPSPADLRMMFDGVAARIATIGQLHRMLARLPAEGAISLKDPLREMGAALVGAFSSKLQPVHIDHGGSECLVLARHVQPLILIVCEILTNALKYAHPAGVPLRITVDCHSTPDGGLVISVGDDGVGLPEGFDSATDGGIGFQVIRSLVAEIGAALNVESDALGVTFHIAVPQAVVANAKSV